MRKTVALTVVACLALALGLAGCKKKGGKSGKRGAAGLVGTWAIDGEKTVAGSDEFSKMKPEQKKQVAEMFGKATLKITKDTITMSGLDKDETDKYTVVSDKGDTVVLESTDSKGKKEKISITYVSDDEVKGSGEKMVLVMKRKK